MNVYILGRSKVCKYSKDMSKQKGKEVPYKPVGHRNGEVDLGHKDSPTQGKLALVLEPCARKQVSEAKK